MTEERSPEQKPVGSVITGGVFRELLRLLPRPVLALGSNDLYCVMLHANGFSIAFGEGAPAIGCLTTRFVSAASVREAERKACIAAETDWRRSGFQKVSGVVPEFTVEELNVLSVRFRRRSGGGFGFYDTP
jgi:hypothetical protein